jgi:shikimate dehydrogenase
LIKSQTPANAELVVWDKTYAIKEDAEILINVTSVGLYPDVHARLNIDVNSLKPGLVVADIVPSPPRTNLIQDAEARGCKTVDGLGMLVNQGVISIQYWSGIDVDPKVMRRKLEEIYQPVA